MTLPVPASRSHELLKVFLLGSCILMICSRATAHAGDKKADPKHKKPHKFGDIDKAHIKHHLDDIGVKTDKMDDKELEFYHFKVHDVNSDSKIDGLEIFRVLKEEEMELIDADDEFKIEDSEVAEQVDSYLKEVDINNDGYIDYSEYRANSHFFIS